MEAKSHEYESEIEHFLSYFREIEFLQFKHADLKNCDFATSAKKASQEIINKN